MLEQTLPLLAAAPGCPRQLTVLRFGTPGSRPKAYLQAALHADELPGMLVLHHLRTALAGLEREGRISGEIVLVPVANPIGLAQQVLGSPLGRFSVADGSNFNRRFPDLYPAVHDDVAARLGPDPGANVDAVRAALAAALAAVEAPTAEQHLKRTLLSLALDADIALDLHCDGEALLHGYTLNDFGDAVEPLARLLGLRALLLADDSGEDPFDEALSRPWLRLARAFPQHPLPLACVAATLELRGEADVDHALARQDAQALLGFLAWRGTVALPPPELPAARYRPTQLAASEPIVVPHAGVVAFVRSLGEVLDPGDTVAELVDPASGSVTPVVTRTGGLLYARCASRQALPGKRIAKIAGERLQRTGSLLSP
jgi:predicted deacylase